jgi:hypothetical protein
MCAIIISIQSLRSAILCSVRMPAISGRRLHGAVRITMSKNKTVLSLFDFSGNWSRPYREAGGYRVIQIDLKLGRDILKWDYTIEKSVDIILAAIPCDNYALSGARWFCEKDKDGRTAYSQKLVAKTKEIIDYFNPEIWVIENPMSRIHKLNPWMGKVKFKFNPYDFGDPYQKTTWLWGAFNNPIKNPVENNGNWMHTNLGGKSERTKMLRSTTPMGFAYAFFEANK